MSRRESKVSPSEAGIHEFHEANASWSQKSTPWKSIYVASALCYCTAVQFSLYFSSMWPYLQTVCFFGFSEFVQLDSVATENFFGVVIAAYSLGQIIGSPVMGWWSNRMKSIRHPLNVCLALSLAGNLTYMAAQLLPHERRYAVLIGRFILGFGAGAIALLRTYASTASTKTDRVRAIASVTGGFALGMTTGPALQLLFSPIGYPGFAVVNELLINMYTAPALMGCVINILGLVLVKFIFVEKYAGLVSKVEVQENGEVVAVKVPPYDRMAVALCYLGRFTQMFCYTNLETLGAPFSMAVFAWSRHEVTVNLAIAHAFLSGFAFCIYTAFVLFKLEKYMNFRRQCLAAFGGLILFHLITFSWPFLPGKLQFHNGNGTGEALGCNPERFSWCDDIRPVNVYLYLISYVVLFGICFPNINISITTLFSHILGPRRQGTQQGIMQMSGSMARLSGPVVISTLYTSFGPRLAWILEIVVLTTTIALWLFNYRRLVPLNEEQPNKTVK